MKRTLIYYTDNRLPDKIALPVRDKLKEISESKNIPIVSCTIEPVELGKNIVLPGKRGYLQMFNQILTALENSEPGIIFFTEHDVLYHPSHFDYRPPTNNKFYYDVNWYKVREDGLAVHWDAAQVSGLVCDRDLAIEWYKNKISQFDSEKFDRKFEPGSEDLDRIVLWKADFPHIDIRHGGNLTYNKWKMEHFRNKATAVNFVSTTTDKIPGWDL